LYSKRAPTAEARALYKEKHPKIKRNRKKKARHKITKNSILSVLKGLYQLYWKTIQRFLFLKLRILILKIKNKVKALKDIATSKNLC